MRVVIYYTQEDYDKWFEDNAWQWEDEDQDVYEARTGIEAFEDELLETRVDIISGYGADIIKED